MIKLSNLTNVLFVCLGNICRSPTAEAVFRKKAAEHNLKLQFDSSGTADYHIGHRSDPRSIKHANKRGYPMTHLGRQVSVEDFYNFDLILAMDNSNLNYLLKLAPTELKYKAQNFTDLCLEYKGGFVPDPYSGTAKDFETVLDIIEDGWQGFYNAIKTSV